MTLGIAHLQRSFEYGVAPRAVLDLVREAVPPFSPDAVVRDFARELRRYGCNSVLGDRYAGEWVKEAFRRSQIAYRIADRVKSEVYQEALPLFTTRQVELPEHAKLRAQLLGLERRTHRGGRESIDHRPQMHDDLANAALGALWLARPRERRIVGWKF